MVTTHQPPPTTPIWRLDEVLGYEWSVEKAICSSTVKPRSNGTKFHEQNHAPQKNFYDELAEPHQAFLMKQANWTSAITQLNDLSTSLAFKIACHFCDLLSMTRAGIPGATIEGKSVV